MQTFVLLAAPVFEHSTYEMSVSRSLPVGSIVLSVTASDADAAENARLTYTLEPLYADDAEASADVENFKMSSDGGGELRLVQPLPFARRRFALLVTARDGGVPALEASVPVIVHTHEGAHAAPQWQPSASCPTRVSVDETLQKNSIVLRCFALTPTDKANDGSPHPIAYSMSVSGDARADPSGTRTTWRDYKNKSKKIFSCILE